MSDGSGSTRIHRASGSKAYSPADGMQYCPTKMTRSTESSASGAVEADNGCASEKWPRDGPDSTTAMSDFSATTFNASHARS